jgi:outer membrane protein OmpA-like peptidoglycan-associated protein
VPKLLGYLRGMKLSIPSACIAFTIALGSGCGGSPAPEAREAIPLEGDSAPGATGASPPGVLLQPSPFTGPDDATDLLQWGAGAFVVRDDTPPTSFTSKALIDGLHDTITIGLPRREPLPHKLVVELPALTTFETFAVPEINEFGPARGRHVATVVLEGSTEGPEAGFLPLAALSIKLDAKAPQHYAVPEPRPIRFLRVTLAERLLPAPADFDPTVFAELIGYGRQEPIAVPPDRFTGRWRYRRTGIHDEPGLNIIELTQKGSSISGCQVQGGKQSPVTGDIVGGIAQLVVEPEGVHGGHPVVATVTSEGALVGARFSGGFLPFWAAPDAQAPAPCTPGPLPADPIVEALRSRRPAIVHGIHFDVDSDTLRPEATPALERVLTALGAAPDVRVVIEGHTDTDGADAHNLTLSARRARAVVQWLTAKGVAAARLEASGKGEAEPIADNATLAGKQLNRRVEIEAR